MILDMNDNKIMLIEMLSYLMICLLFHFTSEVFLRGVNADNAVVMCFSEIFLMYVMSNLKVFQRCY